MKGYGFRSKEARKAYELFLTDNKNRTCPFCAETALKNFEHWKIIEARFPYDRIASTHHLLVTKRHCVQSELTADESLELFKILDSAELNEKYTHVLEVLKKRQSVSEHAHWHLIEQKVFLD